MSPAAGVGGGVVGSVTGSGAQSRLSIAEVPQEISRIFFGEPKPR